MAEHPTGRIDVHSHLLPGIDDGCSSPEESLACAARMVEAGYTHSFCTPHIWPSLAHNTPEAISLRTAELQTRLDAAGIALKLIPGGELNLRADLAATPAGQLPTYAMAGKHCLFDIWVDRLPAYFWPTVEWLQGQGLTVVLAHPERMRAVQDEPGLADAFLEAGLLLQGNLQCFADPPQMATRRTAELFLKHGLYFMLGSDLHNLASLPIRLRGLDRVKELVSEQKVWELTRDHARQLLPPV